jgi:hypothetical protein
MRQRLIGILFIVPGGLVLLGLLGGPYFSQATGAYLVGGILLVAFGVLAVVAGVYYLVKGPRAKLNE